MKERNDTSTKTMKNKSGTSQSTHQNKRSKTTKKKKGASSEKPKEEGVVTSTGAIMVPVSQQFWWKSGPGSSDGNSDFDDEILSGRVNTNLMLVVILTAPALLK